MRVLAVEKLERRTTAAADLVAADALVAEGEDIAVGQFCVPLPPAVASIYEQVDPSIVDLDVDLDGYITPKDAQLVVEQISKDFSNGPFPMTVEGETASPKYQYDINRDGSVSPADALIVLNRVHFYNSLVPCTCSSCLATAIVDGV